MECVYRTNYCAVCTKGNAVEGPTYSLGNQQLQLRVFMRVCVCSPVNAMHLYVDIERGQKNSLLQPRHCLGSHNTKIAREIEGEKRQKIVQNSPLMFFCMYYYLEEK